MEHAEEYLSRIADAMEAIKEAIRPLLISKLSDEEIYALSDEEIYAVIKRARDEGII